MRKGRARVEKGRRGKCNKKAKLKEIYLPNTKPLYDFIGRPRVAVRDDAMTFCVHMRLAPGIGPGLP